MICRVLIKFNQNLSKNQDFKEHKLLTIKLLIIIKDQLFRITFLQSRVVASWVCPYKANDKQIKKTEKDIFFIQVNYLRFYIKYHIRMKSSISRMNKLNFVQMSVNAIYCLEGDTANTKFHKNNSTKQDFHN